MEEIRLTTSEINVIAAMCGIDRLYSFSEITENTVENQKIYSDVFYLTKKKVLEFEEINSGFVLKVNKEISNIFELIDNADVIISTDTQAGDRPKICIYVNSDMAVVIMQSRTNKDKLNVSKIAKKQIIKLLIDVGYIQESNMNERIIRSAMKAQRDNPAYDMLRDGLTDRKELDRIRYGMADRATMEVVCPNSFNLVRRIDVGLCDGRRIILCEEESEKGIDRCDSYMYCNEILERMMFHIKTK